MHYCVLQELGGSKSSYSLSEQLKLNPVFSEGTNTPITFDDIEKFIGKLRKEWKVVNPMNLYIFLIGFFPDDFDLRYCFKSHSE